MQLNFLIYGRAEAYLDRNLVQKIGKQIDLIPKSREREYRFCDYAWCSNCNQRVIRALSYYLDEDDVTKIYIPVYKCPCTGKYWLFLALDILEGEEEDIYEGWQFCHAPAIYYGYLDWHHQTYFRFLQLHLKYVEENSSCECFWPQCNESSRFISDTVYSELSHLLRCSQLLQSQNSFSPYINARSGYGFLSCLLTHAFFYTQYRAILADLDQFSFQKFPNLEYQTIHEKLTEIEEKIQSPFLKLYSDCIENHPHPKIYYERGMVLFHHGQNIDSLEDIRKFITYAEDHKYNELLTSQLYLQEGRLLNETLSYDEALIALTKAIQKDPTNSDAYFERAIAYFENGDFELALADYLASGIHPKRVDPKKIGLINYILFDAGISAGILKGSQEAAIEFVPSILGSLRGLSNGIWAFASNPKGMSQDMMDCAYACLEFIRNNTAQDLIAKLAPEIQEYLQKFDQLSDFAKGQYFGQLIGKYGVDIFIGTGSLKALKLYRDLKRANALMTFDAALTSPKVGREILEQAAARWKIRENLLKSQKLVIEWDKQGKHILDHPNFEPKRFRSELKHSDPECLLRDNAGTGMKDNSIKPGKPGYREVVDFQEFIGYAVDKKTGEKIPTTWGKIHYSNKGAHIVPTRPRK